MRASIYLTRLGALLTLDRHYDGPDATRNTLRARWFSGRKDETSAPRLSLSLSLILPRPNPQLRRYYLDSNLL